MQLTRNCLSIKEDSATSILHQKSKKAVSFSMKKKKKVHGFLKFLTGVDFQYKFYKIIQALSFSYMSMCCSKIAYFFNLIVFHDVLVHVVYSSALSYWWKMLLLTHRLESIEAHYKKLGEFFLYHGYCCITTKFIISYAMVLLDQLFLEKYKL